MKTHYTPAEQAANRETLKAALRAHAEKFDMGSWIEKDVLAEYPESLAEFEACGTACCVDGMASLLFNVAKNEDIGFAVESTCGLDLAVCNTSTWDRDLRKDYLLAVTDSDHTLMVESACSMIDRLAERVTA